MEIIFALSLFVATVAVICSSFDASIGSLKHLDLDAQATDLGMTVVTYLRTGQIDAVEGSARSFEEEPFLLALPGWTYQVTTAELPEPVEGAKLTEVRVDIVYTPLSYTWQWTYHVATPEETPEAGTTVEGGGL